MTESARGDWRRKITEPAHILDKIEPGMTIYLDTGVAEPRLLIRELMASTPTTSRT